MSKKHTKGCSTSLVKRERQIADTTTYDYIPLRFAMINKSHNMNNACAVKIRQMKLSYTASGNSNWEKTFWKTVSNSKTFI